MTEDMNDEVLLRYYEDLLRTDKYRLKITEAGTEYPENRSIIVDFDDIDNFDRDLGEFLLDHPIKSREMAEKAVQRILPPDLQNPLHVRVWMLPDTSNIKIRKLRGEHLGKFNAIDGLVRKITEVRPKLTEGHFMCQKCGFDNIIKQTEMFVQEPYECQGCGKNANQTSFKFLQDFSTYVDTQKIEIQENPEELRGGEQPQRLTAYAEDDITGNISPGDRVTLNGVLMSRQKHKGRMKSVVFDIFLGIYSVEMKQSDYEQLEITEEDVLEIEELAQDPEIYKKLRSSIAPSIYGMEIEKEALSLQVFGGVQKFMPDGTKLRGDVHVLLVGDPGTAKSQLLRYTKQISPRGIYTSGQATTKAGLTATAVKEEFGDGRWTLEAGALVLADKGIACLLPGTHVEVNDSRKKIETLFDKEKSQQETSHGEKMEVAPFSGTVSSLASNTALKSLSAKATKVRRKKYKGEVVDIKLESGFRISLTPDHKLIDGDTLEWKEAGEFRKRDLIISPFKTKLPDSKNNTLTLLRVLSHCSGEKDCFKVEISGKELEILVQSLVRKKRGISKKDRKRILTHLLPDWDGKIRTLETRSSDEYIYHESNLVAPDIMLEIIEKLHKKRRYTKRIITIVGKTGNERYQLNSLPPQLYYLFGRVYADHKGQIRETRPVSLLLQKFSRGFADEYRVICRSSLGKTAQSNSRILKILYENFTRNNLSNIGTFPDPCIRSFLAGLIDTNGNISLGKKQSQTDEFRTITLKLVMPTLEPENLNLLHILRRYNVYGKLIRRKHMHTIKISNDSDVNNIRGLLKDYSINMNQLPISNPHYYEIATTYTTSNLLPAEPIINLCGKIMERDGWSRHMKSLLKKQLKRRKHPVREHFSDIVSEMEKSGKEDLLEELKNLISREYLVDRIVDITKRDYNGWVYDLYVPETHNFAAEGLMVHNCIDELDKMTKEDSSGMHEALEQQQISIAKAGITATLQTRCSTLAAANPKYGRFDDSATIISQINLLPSLISRFDLIFTVLDRPVKKLDRKIAEHILTVHTEGEKIIHRQAEEMRTESDYDVHEAIRPEIEVDIIRKYVAHAKRVSFPVLEKEASEYLSKYYVDFRQKNQDSKTISITARQLEAMVRLAEASARIRLSSEVTMEDAKRAKRVMEYSLDKVAKVSGKHDIDVMMGGVSQKKRSRLFTLRTLMEGLAKESGNGIFAKDDVVDAAKDENIGKGETTKFIRKLLDDGEIYEPTQGTYKFT